MKDIQNKSDRDLATYIAEKREALRTIRFSGAGSGMRDTQATRNTKKEIARALTERNRRNRAATTQTNV